MSRKLYPFERLEAPISPLPSLPKPASRGFARQPSSSSDGKISPIVLLVIVILAVIFFFCGLLHLLVRFLMKRPSFYSFSRYPSNPDSSSSDALHRQLQQLFRLHDSGLDQAIIDSLPVFCYKDIVGSKEPFDCPVCLCEFSDQDKLRLLPDCGHAFHISCIDTWLLSNSTCPLCRGMLVCSGGYSMENRLISLDYFMDLSHMQPDDGDNGHKKPTIMEESAGERRVYSVRLGKFRTVNHEEVGSTRIEHGETSSSNLDARRCYSLGSCQYVIADSDLLVSFSDSLEADVGNKGIGKKLDNTRGWIGNSLIDGDVEAKRISSNSKGESFSVSKIWQWSKKGKFPSSSNANLNQLTKKDESV